MPGEGNRKAATAKANRRENALNNLGSVIGGENGCPLAPGDANRYGQAKSVFGNALSVSSSRNLSRSMMVEPER